MAPDDEQPPPQSSAPTEPRWRFAAVVLAGAVASVPLGIAGGLIGSALGDFESAAAVPYVVATLILGPALWLWLTRRRYLRGVAAGLVVGPVVLILISLAIAALGDGGPRPAETEATLRQLAVSSDVPLYYLGAEYSALPLLEVGMARLPSGEGIEIRGDSTLERGQLLSTLYGEWCGESLCPGSVEIDLQPYHADIFEQWLGCSRVPPLRGVPTASVDGAIVFFIDRAAVKVMMIESRLDKAEAEAAASALREVRQDRSTGADLPLPPEDVLLRIDAACGPDPARSIDTATTPTQ